MPPEPNPEPLRFERNARLLSGRTSLELAVGASNDPAVHRALARNEPLPRRQIGIGKIELGISGAEKVSFGKGKQKASFKFGVEVHGGLGVYQKAAALRKALRLGRQVVPGLTLPSAGDRMFLVLSSGYSLEGGVKGSIALAPGPTPTFSAQAEHGRTFAVIRALPHSLGARDAVQEVVDSWQLPRQVESADSLEPGTWLVAEVDASFAIKIGAKYGYDFNWVRAARAGGLSGDIGLKIELGVSASLGFSAAGKYAVVIARESFERSSRRLRVRLFKLSSNGWNFAFDASTSVDGDTGEFLPDEYDKFIAGVLGLDSGQLINEIRGWVDPETPLEDRIAGEALDLAKDVFTSETGIDPEAEYDVVREKLTELFDRWSQLPHAVASRVWELMALPEELGRVRAVASALAGAAGGGEGNREGVDTSRVNTLLADALEDVDFFDTGVGRWLLAAADDEPLKLLAAGGDAGELEHFLDVARTTASILDGSLVEETLAKLHGYVSRMLKIDDLRAGLDEAAFEKLDAWSKKKLGELIGRRIDFSGLDDVRRTIDLLDSRAQSFYDKSLEALNRKYEFEFAYKFQTATAKTALLDLELDFAAGDGVAGHLKKVLSGDLDDLLLNRRPGVHLKTATLTHEITRQASVEITMPWLHKSSTSRTEALAKLDALDTDNGRLLAYSLDADNNVTKVRSRSEAQSYRASGLAVAGRLEVPGNRVSVGSTRKITASYDYRVAEPGMRTTDLVEEIGPYAKKYFPDQFGGDDAPRFEVWAAELDRRIDENGETRNGPLMFGNTLVTLEVALPGKLGGAWLGAPRQRTDPRYLALSLRLQEHLRELLTFHFFSNTENFRSLPAAHALLMYASTPAANGLRASSAGRLRRTDHTIHWDYASSKVRGLMTGSAEASERLGMNLARARARLQKLPNADGLAGHYERGRSVRRTVSDGLGEFLLVNLFRVENRVANRAVDAGIRAAEFAASREIEPARALEGLARFGVAATEAFNKELTSGKAYGKAPLRPLGAMLYVEALRALDPDLGDEAIAAMLDVQVVRKGVTFPPVDFPDHERLGREELVIRERVVSG